MCHCGMGPFEGHIKARTSASGSADVKIEQALYHEAITIGGYSLPLVKLLIKSQ